MEHRLNPENDPHGEAGIRRKRRRFALVDIKLLRLSLVQKEESPCLGLSVEWIPAQPSENLSPFVAAQHLGVHPWSLVSTVKQRYRKLQLRYPPEQFSDRHTDWRPSAELLSAPLARLNWYWQSGLVPGSECMEGMKDTFKPQAAEASVGSVHSPERAISTGNSVFNLDDPAGSLLNGLRERLLAE
jgi:hypothetical protein